VANHIVWEGGEVLPGHPARVPPDPGADSAEALHRHRSRHAAFNLQVSRELFIEASQVILLVVFILLAHLSCFLLAIELIDLCGVVP
jgi:hypothetical protein